MEPITTAALIAGAASAVSQGGQAVAQGKMNRKTRQWNEKMYGIQRQHALEDWDKQNAYNSPVQQMARFKEAGLNPNLIYGQSSDAGAVRSTNVQSWNPDTPNVASIGNTVGDTIGQYMDIEMRQQQIANMEQSRKNAEVDNSIKSLDVLLRGAMLEKNQFQNAHQKELFDAGMAKLVQSTTLLSEQSALTKAKWRGEYLNQGIATRSDARNEELHSFNKRLKDAQINNLNTSSIKNHAELGRIAAQIANIAQSTDLSKKDLELLNSNLSRNTPVLDKLIVEFADGNMSEDEVSTVLKKIAGLKLNEQADIRKIFDAVKFFKGTKTPTPKPFPGKVAPRNRP